MGWNNYNINWNNPEYWKADCLDALRRAILERAPFYSNKNGQTERSFAQINNTFAVNRESGDILFTHDYYNNNNFSLGYRDAEVNKSVTNPIIKPMGCQKLSFHQYTQMGHAIDAAIQKMVYSSTYMWIRWWEVDNFEGIYYDTYTSPTITSMLTPKSTLNCSTYHNFAVITEVTDILEYIGDDQLYLFSDYGDNTKWARQKYHILNALKVFVQRSPWANPIATSQNFNAMGSYVLHRKSKHSAWYSKDTDAGHPDDPDYNSEAEGGDLPVETSLSAVFEKLKTNAKTPYYDSDGAFVDSGSYYGWRLYCSAHTGMTTYPDGSVSITDSSFGNLEYDEFFAGALATRASVPLNVDTYAMLFEWGYNGSIGINPDTKYDHNNEIDPEYIHRWAPFESWNPLGLGSNELRTLQYVKSYRLEAKTDFQDAIVELFRPSAEIPSLPTIPEQQDEYRVFKTGSFSAYYYYQFLHVIKPEFEFQG